MVQRKTMRSEPVLRGRVGSFDSQMHGKSGDTGKGRRHCVAYDTCDTLITLGKEKAISNESFNNLGPPGPVYGLVRVHSSNLAVHTTGVVNTTIHFHFQHVYYVSRLLLWRDDRITAEEQSA